MVDIKWFKLGEDDFKLVLVDYSSPEFTSMVRVAALCGKDFRLVDGPSLSWLEREFAQATKAKQNADQYLDIISKTLDSKR